MRSSLALIVFFGCFVLCCSSQQGTEDKGGPSPVEAAEPVTPVASPTPETAPIKIDAAVAFAFPYLPLKSPVHVKAGRVQLRVLNKTGLDLSDLVVGRTKFGTLGSGETSEYQWFEEGAYRYGYVEAKAGARAMKIQPKDYMGETPLPTGGSYTYELSLQDGSLQMVTRRER